MDAETYGGAEGYSQNQEESYAEKYDLKNLAISMGIDALGMASYLFPGIGETSDLAFAPLQAYWIKRTYGSSSLAALGFGEEILPGTDIIPTCTIAHIMHYRDSKKRKSRE